MSGSKPRIQKLCQTFETQKDQVDLSDHSPHDITSILKHFFKEVLLQVLIKLNKIMSNLLFALKIEFICLKEH